MPILPWPPRTKNLKKPLIHPPTFSLTEVLTYCLRPFCFNPGFIATLTTVFVCCNSVLILMSSPTTYV